MDQDRFDAVARTLSHIPSRRDLLLGLAGLGLALGSARLPGPVEAGKKRKNKKRKKTKNQQNPTPPPVPNLPPSPNAYGCLSVNVPCTSAAECCSNVCEGGTCRAHGAGMCRQDRPGVCSATTTDVPTFVCGNGCYCFGATAGSNFCAIPPAAVGSPKCADCKKDADCLALGYPSGSACVPVELGHCSGRCASGMACLVPCGVELPEPATP